MVEHGEGGAVEVVPIQGSSGPALQKLFDYLTGAIKIHIAREDIQGKY